MPQRTYPELKNQRWDSASHTHLLSLHAAAKSFAGPPEDPASYIVFDTLMASLSLQYYGVSPTTPATDTEADAGRLHHHDTRRAILEETLGGPRDADPALPHPFDLARSRLSLQRPWPDSNETSTEDLWWRLEVLSWYEEWPVMSPSPVDLAVARREVEVKRRLLLEKGRPGMLERVVTALKRTRGEYRRYTEERRVARDADDEENERHRRVCGRPSTCDRCRRPRRWWRKRGSPPPRF